MKQIIISIIVLLPIYAQAQGNCLLYPEGSGERKACEMCTNSGHLKQGSREKQRLFDKAIEIGPNYAWSYYQKSIPYFKRGFVLEGMQLLNKAVELAPTDHLCYRAYWHFQNRNYELCLKDLERYYTLVGEDAIAFTTGGDMDMRLIRAMCYAKLGDTEKGIDVAQRYIDLKAEDDFYDPVDFHILGMLLVLNNQYDQGIKLLTKSASLTPDYPDTYYYLAIAYMKKGRYNQALKQLRKGKQTFSSRSHLRNGYFAFRVYLSDIERLIKEID